MQHIKDDEDSGNYRSEIRSIQAILSALGLKVVGLEKDMGVVQEGVANFRDFQRTNLEFMGWFKAKEERRAEKEAEEKEAREKLDNHRARIHYWWLGILSGVILLAIAAFFTWAVHFMETHHISQAPVTITRSTPQDASNPPY